MSKPNIIEEGIEKKYCTSHKCYHDLTLFGTSAKENRCKEAISLKNKKSHVKNYVPLSEEEKLESFISKSVKKSRNKIERDGKIFTICNKCKKEKEINNFASYGPNRKYVDGSQKYHGICLKCEEEM